MNETKNTVVISREVKIEVSPADFEPLSTLAYLDLDLLSEAEKTKIELGSIATDCGRRTVSAVVEKGMVTELEIGSCCGDCGEAREVEPAMAELLDEATSALGMNNAATRALPAPIGDFVRPGGPIVEWWTCVRICIFGWCFVCCYGQDPNSKWIRCM